MFFVELGQEFGATSDFQYLFIITITIVWLSLVIYSLKKEGIRKTTRYFLPMMIAALFIEASAVANGRFRYPGYLIYFNVLGGSVPFIILIGWSSNLYLFLQMSKSVVTKLYQKINIIQLLLISTFSGIFGICLDLLEDPLAHHNNWWIWTESTGGLTFFSVPFSNFMDWFIILFFMSLATIFIEKSGYSENRKLILAFTSLTLVFAAIYLSHTVLTEAFQFIGVI